MKGPNPLYAISAGFLAAVLVVGVLNLGDARHEHALETGCNELPKGANLEEIVQALGLTGYRPGCATTDEPGTGLPCQRTTVGELTDFPYLCEGTDCSLYWRIGDGACLVELDPRDKTLLRAEYMALAQGIPDL